MSGHVEVALPLPLLGAFTYRIEGPAPAPGTRVLVPFRNRERVGWVVGPGDPAGLKRVRRVLDVVEREPSVSPELLDLARWMGRYYVTPLGIVLRAMTPGVVSDAAAERLTLSARGKAILQAAEADEALGTRPQELSALSPGALAVFEGVARREGGVKVATLRGELGPRARSIWPGIRTLVREGLIEHETEAPPPPPVLTRKVVRLVRELADLAVREELFGRAHRQEECFELLARAGGERSLADLQQEDGFSRSVIAGLEEKGLVSIEDQEVLRDPFGGEEPGEAVELTPTPAQAAAIRTLRGAIHEERPLPFLLHGITSSGKTLVYIRLLQEVVNRRGKTALVLVPEISLTPQAVSRFRAWFGDRVAVLHSALSDGERYDQWRQIRTGQKRIVVGARSALFAPLPQLGAIIVDEEHDGSYKQSEAPRYHARDVAVMRAARSGAICVLGSATPSLESWQNAKSGKFRLLTLPERATGVPLPPVEIVDLRQHRGGKRDPREGGGILAPPLVAAIRECLAKEEQTILLLNRRGYASFVQCRACGEVEECPHCSVSLTYHRGRGILLCHHCRYETGAPTRCHACGGTDLSFRGLGTEQVERVVAETFPAARIARMDVDTTSGKWSHAAILGRVGRGEVDILLGTQMIAKGLDFPRVTVVGVVNADVGIHLPDFRASERAFQLLSQVAGRAGRGTLGGSVLIQTSLPQHYAVRAAVEHDYVGFAERELEERTSPPYPPHLRMVNVILSSPDPELAATGAEEAMAWFRSRVKSMRGVELVGPAPSPIERLHGRWRWHFFLRGGAVDAVTDLLTTFLRERPIPSGELRAVVDRDPVALL